MKSNFFAPECIMRCRDTILFKSVDESLIFKHCIVYQLFNVVPIIHFSLFRETEGYVRHLLSAERKKQDSNKPWLPACCMHENQAGKTCKTYM